MTKRQLAVMCWLVATPTYGWEQSGYQYHADADRPVQYEEARRIVEGAGGYFVGPRELATITSVPVQSIPPSVPYTARELLDCQSPCALVLNVATIGASRVPATIRNLIRMPVYRERINLGESRLTAWFLQEPFATRPLPQGWILASVGVLGRGLSYSRRVVASSYKPLDTVSSFWLVSLLPRDVFTGQLFFTDDRLANGDVVVVGRNQTGALVIDRRLPMVGYFGVGHLQAMRRSYRVGDSRPNGDRADPTRRRYRR